MAQPYTKKELTRKVRKHVRAAHSQAKKRRVFYGPLGREPWYGRLVHTTHNYGSEYCWWCLNCGDVKCCAGIVRPCKGIDTTPCKKAAQNGWFRQEREKAWVFI